MNNWMTGVQFNLSFYTRLSSHLNRIRVSGYGTKQISTHNDNLIFEWAHQQGWLIKSRRKNADSFRVECHQVVNCVGAAGKKAKYQLLHNQNKFT